MLCVFRLKVLHSDVSYSAGWPSAVCLVPPPGREQYTCSWGRDRLTRISSGPDEGFQKLKDPDSKTIGKAVPIIRKSHVLTYGAVIFHTPLSLFLSSNTGQFEG
jgi:hypothetical protein